MAKNVPGYRLHKPSGQAYVRLSGRMYYLGPYRSKASKEEYNRLVSEWLAAGRSPSFSTAPAELTVVELVAGYLRWAKTYYVDPGGKPTPYVPLLKPTLDILLKLYGRTPAVEFGPLALKAVRERMIEKGWARSHVNRHVGNVKRIFKWAAGEELIPMAIHENLRAVVGLKRGRTEAPETKPIGPVTEADVQATLPHLPEVVSDMVRFERLTGCRPAEVCMVRPIDVNTTGEVWQYRPEIHKTQYLGRERIVFIGPKAQDILRKYLLRPAEAYCFSPAESEKKRRAEVTARRRTPLSYGNRVGTNRKPGRHRVFKDRYDRDSYRKAIHRGCDKAGIPRWSPNRLRHSAATEIRKKYGLEAAQVALGHATADVSQIYAERDYELAAKVAKKLG